MKCSHRVKLFPSNCQNSAVFFALYVLCTLPLCFLGYGSDNDTYGVLDAGRSTWLDGHLATSRHPGYWLYEAFVYAISRFGGYVATNIASMSLGAFILWRVIVLCRKMKTKHEYLLAGCIMCIPTFLIAASSTIDYVWSLAFLVAAVELLLNDKLASACIAGAICIGFRGSNSLVLAGAYAGLLIFVCMYEWDPKKLTGIVITGVCTCALAALFFVPSWMVAHHTMEFLTPMAGPPSMWSFKMHAGRVIYKTAYLFGPIATAIFLYLLAKYWRSKLQIEVEPAWKKYSLVFAGAWVGNIVLFAKFPLEVSYLLPGAVFFVLLAGMSFLHTRNQMLAVLCATVSFNFVMISFAKPNIPLHATNARLSFNVEEGVLLEDIAIRIRAKKCSTGRCWEKYAAAQPGL